MERPEVTVKSHLHRGRRKMLRFFEEHESAELLEAYTDLVDAIDAAQEVASS